MRLSLILLLPILFLSACSHMAGSKRQKLSIERRWTRSTYAKEFNEYRRLNRFRPLLTEKFVIDGNGVDSVVAYDRDLGHEQWRIPIKDGVEGGAQLVQGQLFFGGSDGFFYAVDASNAKVRWSFPIRSEALGEPLVNEGKVYFLAGNNVAYALDADTGRQLWLYSRRDASSLSIRGAARPAIAGDLVIFGFSDGSLVALRKDTGTLVWEISINRNKRFKDADTNPVVLNGQIFTSSFDGSLVCVNAADGKVLWTLDEGGYAELSLDGDRLYASTSTGQVLAVDKRSGKVLWRHSNKRGISGQPILYKGLVIVGEYGGSLHFLEADSGKSIAEFDPGRGVTSAPTLDAQKGEIYFMSADANLFALRLAWKKAGSEWPWE